MNVFCLVFGFLRKIESICSVFRSSGGILCGLLLIFNIYASICNVIALVVVFYVGYCWFLLYTGWLLMSTPNFP